MIRRLGIGPKAIVMLCVYAAIVWMTFDHVYPDPYWTNSSEWYTSVITSGGEILYRKSNSKELYRPDGTALTQSENAAAMQQGLLQDYYSNTWTRNDRELYGYRWRDAWQALVVRDFRGGFQTALPGESDVVPIIDEHTYAIYAPNGVLRGRLTPHGFVTGNGDVRGFNPNAVTSWFGGDGDPFFLVDTTGFYRISIDPPEVARIFEAPATTQAAEIVGERNDFGEVGGLSIMEFITDTEVYIGTPHEMSRITLPPERFRSDSGSFGFNIKMSQDLETIALVYNTAPDLSRFQLFGRKSGTLLLDTVTPRFATHPQVYANTNEYERHEIVYAMVQPLVLPALVCAIDVAWIIRRDSINMPRGYEHYFLGGAVALLIMHLTGALTGFLLARRADARPRVTIFWALVGLVVSFPVVIVYPFYTSKFHTIPCRSCGRALHEPQICPACGTRQVETPLIT